MTGKEFIEFGKVIEFDLVPRIFGYIVDCGLIHPPIEFGPRYNFGAPYGSFERKSRRKRLILWKLRIIYWKFGIFEGAPEAHLIIYWKIRIFGVPPKAHLLILTEFRHRRQSLESLSSKPFRIEQFSILLIHSLGPTHFCPISHRIGEFCPQATFLSTLLRLYSFFVYHSEQPRVPFSFLSANLRSSIV